MEPLHGARPKWNRVGRPTSVTDEPRGLEAEATGGIDGLDVEECGAPAPQLPPPHRDMQGAGVLTPPRRDVDGHGGLRTPGHVCLRGGNEWLPRFLQKLGIRMLVWTVGTPHGPLRTFLSTRRLVYKEIWRISGLSLASFGRRGPRMLCLPLDRLHSRQLKYPGLRVRPVGTSIVK